MILPAATAVALIAIVLAAHAALHHHHDVLLAAFDADLDQIDPGAQPDVVRLYQGNHRGGPKPGSLEEDVARTLTQPVPVVRQVRP